MPELPEVEVVRRGLSDHVVGRRITTVEVTGARDRAQLVITAYESGLIRVGETGWAGPADG